MIYFKPNVLTTASCTVRFQAIDDDQILGTCDLLLHDDLADIVAVRLNHNDLSVGEGLFRTAYNFAANRGFYIGCCSAADHEAVRSMFPFEWKNGMWRNDIPTLLAGTCGKN